MDDASELRDNANVTSAPLLSASESEAAEDSSIDPRVNNVAQNFGSAPLMTTTTSNVDIDRITERLDREVAQTKMHRLQTQSHWRMVLIKEKIQELHNEIPRLIQIHTDNVSRKKDVIDALHQEITSLQELYRDAMIANMNRIDNLITLHDDTVVKLEREFHDRVSMLQSQYRKEFEVIDLQYSKEKETIRHTIQTQTENANAQISALRHDHSRELDEIQRRNTDIINNMRSMMESKREDLEEQVEYSHNDFVTTTSETRSTYNQLKSKDDIMRAEISAKMHHANQLQRAIQHLRLIAKQEEAQISKRHTELVERKARAIAKWNLMQEEITVYRTEQQTRLYDLIRRANERKGALIHQVELAQRVTKIALSCQQWESSRDKFASLLRDGMLLPSTCSNQGEGGGGGADEEESTTTEEEEKMKQQQAVIVECMKRLGDTTHQFWNKYNLAKLDVLTLEREVRRLKTKEDEIRMKLKLYHDGIVVTNEAMQVRNPLFVINGKMNAFCLSSPLTKSPIAGGKSKRISVVEGNHYVGMNK
jgi:hypothetical protein